MKKQRSIQIKRVYESPKEEDGYRILVDRIWPRGIKKEELKLDEWAKELAPSTELRKWYSHIPDRFSKFSKLYLDELAHKKESLQKIIKISEKQTVTLLYSARDADTSQAKVLLDTLINL